MSRRKILICETKKRRIFLLFNKNYKQNRKSHGKKVFFIFFFSKLSNSVNFILRKQKTNYIKFAIYTFSFNFYPENYMKKCHLSFIYCLLYLFFLHFFEKIIILNNYE